MTANEWDEFFNTRFGRFTFLHGSEISEASFQTTFGEDIAISESHNPSQTGPDPRFLEYGEGLELSTYASRKLPRYLLAMTILSDTNRVDDGHFEYWRATGAYASCLISHLRKRRMENRRERDLSSSYYEMRYGWLEGNPLSEERLHELCILLQLGLLGRQDAPFPTGLQFVPVQKVLNHPFQVASKYGFPTLEGLASDYCPDRRRLQQRLSAWFENEANQATAETFLEFNRLSRVNSDADEVLNELNALIDPDELDNREGLIRGDGFLRKLKDARNDTMHGDIGRGVAVTVTTLASLAFWDALTDKQYDRLREKLELNLASGPSEGEQLDKGRYWTPWDFYQHYHGRRFDGYVVEKQ